MDKVDFYHKQLVEADQLDQLETDIERAIARVLEIHAITTSSHVLRGLAPSPDGATLVLPISAGQGMAAYSDADGHAIKRLVRLVADSTIDLADSVPNANPRWVLVGLRFLRAESEQVIDGNNVTLYYRQAESAEIVLTDGVEGASPAKPAIPSDTVPICDVRLGVGATAITTAMVDLARARTSWAKRAGGVQAQLEDIAAASIGCCLVVPDSPASMDVAISAGRVSFASGSVSVAATSETIPASPTGGNHRVTLVALDTTGAVVLRHGTEALYAATPAAPSHVGLFPLAEITVRADSTAIVASMITDVRPFLRSTREAPNRYTLPSAVGGETAITLPFEYELGANALQVYVNGALLRSAGGAADYVETDATTITIAVALVAGDTLEVIAGIPGDAVPAQAHASTHGAAGSDPIDYATLDGVVTPNLLIETTGDLTMSIGRFCAIVGGRMRDSGGSVSINVGAIAASTWFYLFGYVSGSALSVEVSTTAPDSARRYKTGDTTRVYLGAFRSTSASNIRAFRRVGRVTTYVTDDNAGAGTALSPHVQSHTGDTVQTAKSMVDHFPPHASAGVVVGVFVDGGAGTRQGSIYGKGTQVSRMILGSDPLTGAVPTREALVTLDGSTQIDLKVENAAHTMKAAGVRYED